MSVARLLLSGLLVASGLILAAFTLHGSFDSRQTQASAAQGPALKPWSTNTFEAGGRLAPASPDRSERQPPQAQAARASLKPDSKPPGAAAAGRTAADAKAAAVKARRRLAERRRAEKRLAEEQAQKAKQQAQQAALQWPWSLFGN